MSGKSIRLELPTDNPIGSTPGHQGTAGHAEDHDKIREILAVLVDGFVPGKLGDLSDVNTDAVGDGIGAGYALVWDGGKFAPVELPTPVTGALVSGATLRLQYPDGSYTDVVLPVNTGPAGVPGAAGRGISSLQFSDVNGDRHLNVIYSDDPNNPVDVGPVPRGVPGSNGADGRSLTSAAVNAAGRLVLTYSDGTTVDAGNVVGPAGVGSFADSFRGMYSATTTYAKNDIVSNGGDTYFSRIDSNTGNTPVPDQTSAQWAILALNGAKGDTGGQGPIGATPTLSVGTVTTLDPDSSATATFTGTPAAPVLNLSLPRGSTGLKGDRGVDGAVGSPGSPGAAGRSISALTLSATNVLTVTYSDSTSTVVGTIATVKGDTGSTGPAPALTIGTVSTLTAGTPATATITGTTPNYALNLGLPLPTPAPATLVRGVYSTANSYAVGDVVSYQGALYQATAAVAAGSAFPTGSFLALTTLSAGTQQVRGLWSATTAYAAKDVVGYMGMLYQANVAVPAAGAPFSAPLTSTVAPMTATGGTPNLNATTGASLVNGIQLSANPDATRTSPVGYAYSVRLTTDGTDSLAYVAFGSGPTPNNSEYSATGGANVVVIYDGTTLSTRLGQGTNRVSGPSTTLAGRTATVDLSITIDASSILRVQASVNGAAATTVLTWNIAQYSPSWLNAGITYYLYPGTNGTTRFSQVLVTPTTATFPTASFTMLTTDRQQVRGTWAPSTDYLVGDVVGYQGVVYQASTTHTSGSTFTAAQWSALSATSTGGAGTPVGAAVTRTTTLAVANNTNTILPFTATDTNSATGSWSSTTNPERLMATVSGWHTVTFSVRYSAQTTASRRALLAVNGVTMFTAATPAPSDFNDPFVTGSYNVFLNVGDYLTLTAYQNSGSSVNVTAAGLAFVR